MSSGPQKKSIVNARNFWRIVRAFSIRQLMLTMVSTVPNSLKAMRMKITVPTVGSADAFSVALMSCAVICAD